MESNLALATELKAILKEKIKSAQQKRDYNERIGKAGMCINYTGKIEAYNDVIANINRLTTS